MKVYDFDKTIYKSDSTLDFYWYCIKKQPSLIFSLPMQLKGAVLYMTGKIDKTSFKEHFYCFLNRIDDKKIDQWIEEFWSQHISRINEWYIKQKQATDVIISASPEFLLIPIEDRLGIHKVMASRVDKYSGRYSGSNCYGEEKVHRYRELFKDQEIDEFYSDSLSDRPLADLAKNSFIVEKDTIISWGDYREGKISQLKHLLFSKQFLLFVGVGLINTFNGIWLALVYSLYFSPNAAFIIGYLTSLTISYFLNSWITFKEKLEVKKYIAFCISYIPNFIIQNVIVLLIYNMLGYSKIWAYIVAAIIGVPITFICMKLLAFREREN